MSAFSGAAFSEHAFDPHAFDFGGFPNVSFSSSAFSTDAAFASPAFSFDGGVVLGFRPGRVYKGAYPYWVPHKKKPLEELDDEEADELFLLLCIALGIFRLI